jgi:hypothetical protein
MPFHGTLTIPAGFILLISLVPSADYERFSHLHALSIELWLENPPVDSIGTILNVFNFGRGIEHQYSSAHWWHPDGLLRFTCGNSVFDIFCCSMVALSPV